MKSQLQLYKCCILSDYRNLTLKVLMPREISVFRISVENLVTQSFVLIHHCEVFMFCTLQWFLTSFIQYWGKYSSPGMRRERHKCTSTESAHVWQWYSSGSRRQMGLVITQRSVVHTGDVSGPHCPLQQCTSKMSYLSLCSASDLLNCNSLFCPTK